MNSQTKKIQKIFSGLYVFFLLLFLSSGSIQAIEYGGFGGRPAFPRPDNPRSDSIFIHTLEPGSQQNEGVHVINNTDADHVLMVYAADSTPSSDGGFACRQLTEPKEGVGSWIKFDLPVWENADDTNTSTTTESTEGETDEELDTDGDGLTDIQEKELSSNLYSADSDNDGISDKEEFEAGTDLTQPMIVTVPGQSKVLIPFTIRVPESVSVGEHDGCILIQEKKEDKLESGISLATRTGMRVAITVPGDVVKFLEIASFEVSSGNNGAKILKPSIRNTGNVSVDADVKVLVKSIFGQTVHTFGGVYAILREDTASWNFEFNPTFWGGLYQAELSATFDDKNLSHPVVWFWLWPQPAGAAAIGGIIILATGLLFVWWFRRRQKQWVTKTWKSVYKVKSGDDLYSVASAYKVNWKLLAKMNKIKPPYSLRPGMNLRVPPKLKSASKPRARAQRRPKN